ncbi:PREDICTED: probable long-chain-alcohol O-fatty-acyltransferase 4 [Camelina sativa]|uniref:Probable long-chain-alcohol O-fatty-acyltransferase 4 n=1 Tax=Camelina sativa TaxID=90675 RepID=A0ABM0XFC2_CAMSA|nr:PREDICTED: probable long-chain-alcohol O-fatty-acyltransferase 4 [Camelina sativa]
MDEEFKRLIEIWVLTTISVSYCYYLSTKIKAGISRLISVLPVCAMFLVLPFFFSSLHICGTISFFLSGTANLKLILFSFDQGPLFPVPPNLAQFICLTCFPIKLQQNPKPHQNHFPKSKFAIKVAIFGMLLHFYDYKQNLPPVLLFAVYSLQIYLEYELFLTLVKVLATNTLGCDLEPQFNEPYLATSLQDFWGRRWNLMVPAILRPAIYVPVWRLCKGRMSSDWARFLAVLATFIVSGVAHEVFFFTLTFEMPTGEVTWFFVLHGLCTATEAVVKRTSLVQRWRMGVMVSRLLTVGFVVMTGGLLFFPQLTRTSVMERRANETLLFINFFKRKFFLWVI